MLEIVLTPKTLGPRYRGP